MKEGFGNNLVLSTGSGWNTIYAFLLADVPGHLHFFLIGDQDMSDAGKLFGYVLFHLLNKLT